MPIFTAQSGTINSQPGQLEPGYAPAAAPISAPVVILRRPVLEVLLNGTPITNPLAARAQLGYNMRYGQGEATFRSLSGVTIVPSDTVQIVMGASSATAAARFTGFLAQTAPSLYEQLNKLNLWGNLGRAQLIAHSGDTDMSVSSAPAWQPSTAYPIAGTPAIRTVNHAGNVYGLVTPGTSASSGGPTGTSQSITDGSCVWAYGWPNLGVNGHGAPDQAIVATLLADAKILSSYPPPIPAAIGGMGRLLGTISQARGFDCDPNTKLLEFIELLDGVCGTVSGGVGGGWRTFDTPDGTVTRQLITTLPAAEPAFTFTEGVDILRADILQDITTARNQIVQDGYDGDSNTREYIAQGANGYLLGPGGAQWYATDKRSSAMIEFDTEAHRVAADSTGSTGISCQEVANWQLGEQNRFIEKATFVTQRDDVIPLGATILIASPHLGVSRNYWVQQTDCQAARTGAFNQTLNCLGSIPAPS